MTESDKRHSNVLLSYRHPSLDINTPYRSRIQKLVEERVTDCVA